MRDDETPREWRARMETEKYWKRYNALPFREKIRRHGVVWWLTNTNVGLLLLIALMMLAATGLLMLLSADV